MEARYPRRGSCKRPYSTMQSARARRLHRFRQMVLSASVAGRQSSLAALLADRAGPRYIIIHHNHFSSDTGKQQQQQVESASRAQTLCRCAPHWHGGADGICAAAVYIFTYGSLPPPHREAPSAQLRSVSLAGSPMHIRTGRAPRLRALEHGTHVSAKCGSNVAQMRLGSSCHRLICVCNLRLCGLWSASIASRQACGSGANMCPRLTRCCTCSFLDRSVPVCVPGRVAPGRVPRQLAEFPRSSDARHYRMALANSGSSRRHSNWHTKSGYM